MKVRSLALMFVLAFGAYSFKLRASEPQKWCETPQVYYDFALWDCDEASESAGQHSCTIYSVKKCRDGERSRSARFCVGSQATCYDLAREFERE